MEDRLDFVIRGGTVVTADGQVATDIGIRHGAIAQLGDLPPARHEIDATGKLVLPGGIDAHVHLSRSAPPDREPAWCDDFYSGTRAAAAGGITTVGNMTFPWPGQSLRAAIERDTEDAAANAVVDVILHPVLTDPDSQPLSDLDWLAAEGHSCLKFFTSIDGFRTAPAYYLDAMRIAVSNGMMTLVHCEDAAILNSSLHHLVATGRTSVAHYPEARPVAAEVAATARVVHFAEVAAAPIYIVHLSAEAALAEVRRGRERGVPIYVETRPLYLYLTAERFREPDGAKYVGQPPLRAASDLAALWHGLATGQIQTVCSDHAPWRFADKVWPGVDVTTVRPGVADLETLMPMLFAEGVGSGRLTLEQFVAVTATNAAKLFGLFPHKGTIATGADADLAIWDPAMTKPVATQSFVTNADYSPYEGWPVTGWPVMTLSRGEIVFDRGSVTTARGRGRLPRRGSTMPLAAMDTSPTGDAS